MAQTVNPSLGYKVTTSTISWNQRVRQIEGDKWNLPQAAYKFGNNSDIVFVRYNFANTGPGNP